MAVIDNYNTDATGEITAHVSDSGHDYLAIADNADWNVVETGDDDYAQRQFGEGLLTPDDDLGVIEHFAKTRGATIGTAASDRFGIYFGGDANGIAGATTYYAYIKGDGEWDLFESDAGTDSALTIQNAISGFNAATEYELRGWVDDEGNPHVAIDGVEVTGAVTGNITPGTRAGGYGREASARIYYLETGLGTGATVQAPNLTNPTGTATGDTTATGTVDTDQGSGTLSWVVTTSATAPTGAQVRAGQDHNGAAAAASGSQAVSQTGTQTVNATGLTAETQYYFHFQHRILA